MKKSNMFTLLSLIIIVIAVVLFIALWKVPSLKNSENPSNTSSSSSVQTAPSGSEDKRSSESKITESTNLSSDAKQTGTENTSTNTTPVSMDNSLFIGDSRTVGLMEYAAIDEADFFCTVGMSVYNIHKKPVAVPTVGKVTLTELLDNRKYDKIYIMLGVNEVGYKFSSTVDKYRELIQFIKDKQPNAIVFIQANLHVTKSRSDSDKIVNNTAINGLNLELSKLANGKDVFYFDANSFFDDTSGNLSPDKSEDGTHLYAKYYQEWGKWIIMQTMSFIGEG